MVCLSPGQALILRIKITKGIPLEDLSRKNIGREICFLGSPFLFLRLPGLMSRWTMPWKWQYIIPWRVWAYQSCAGAGGASTKGCHELQICVCMYVCMYGWMDG